MQTDRMHVIVLRLFSSIQAYGHVSLWQGNKWQNKEYQILASMCHKTESHSALFSMFSYEMHESMRSLISRRLSTMQVRRRVVSIRRWPMDDVADVALVATYDQMVELNKSRVGR